MKKKPPALLYAGGFRFPESFHPRGGMIQAIDDSMTVLNPPDGFTGCFALEGHIDCARRVGNAGFPFTVDSNRSGSQFSIGRRIGNYSGFRGDGGLTVLPGAVFVPSHLSG